MASVVSAAATASTGTLTRRRKSTASIAQVTGKANTIQASISDHQSLSRLHKMVLDSCKGMRL